MTVLELMKSLGSYQSVTIYGADPMSKTFMLEIHDSSGSELIHLRMNVSKEFTHLDFMEKELDNSIKDLIEEVNRVSEYINNQQEN